MIICSVMTFLQNHSVSRATFTQGERSALPVTLASEPDCGEVSPNVD
jgi:hypothetical protein